MPGLPYTRRIAFRGGFDDGVTHRKRFGSGCFAYFVPYKPADAKGKAENVPVPVMPELAKENSKAGLEAFIGYWYATYSYATETGDLGPWVEITGTSNPVTAAYMGALERNHSPVDG
ncbi:DUF6318 family protein [Paenarthrobacter nicotinovorans]|uniref:DUF6318 family protein n=1 Tax=Paenarthrobacter nicotinovorans TaxID=29320 RepID=UPI003A7F946E